MGQAKRRKELGLYPEVMPKPRAETRLKPPLPRSPHESFLGNIGSFALLT